MSKQLNDWYVHLNGGLTWLPKAQGELRRDSARERERYDLVSPFVAASAIYRLCRC